jgi:hypothetical protein
MPFFHSQSMNARNNIPLYHNIPAGSIRHKRSREKQVPVFSTKLPLLLVRELLAGGVLQSPLSYDFIWRENLVNTQLTCHV